MVNNTNYILDESENKFLPIEYMKPDYVIEFERQMDICKQVVNAICTGNNDYIKARTREDVEEMNSLYTKWEKVDFVSMHYFHHQGIIPRKEYKIIAKLMGVEPFRTSVMINISPNWKGKFDLKGVAGKAAIKHFKNTIETYLKTCNRYSKWKFVLECGGDGDFLHAHIVAQINPKIEKSVITHLNKGNHKIELMKFWDKEFSYTSYPAKGTEGVLKGKFAVQRILIRKEDILADKLNYLIEENKPDGHKNSYDLNCLFGDY